LQLIHSIDQFSPVLIPTSNSPGRDGRDRNLDDGRDGRDGRDQIGLVGICNSFIISNLVIRSLPSLPSYRFYKREGVEMEKHKNVSKENGGEPELRTCESCRHWNLYRVRHSRTKRVVDYGLCRRYPPTVEGIGIEAQSTWPEAHADSWCGEYAPKPTTKTK